MKFLEPDHFNTVRTNKQTTIEFTNETVVHYFGFINVIKDFMVK